MWIGCICSASSGLHPDIFALCLSWCALTEERFKWPSPSDELLPLTGEQINWLLDGYDISLLQGHRKLHYDAGG